jgi:hypothetical protein
VSGVSYRAVEVSGTVVNQLPPPGTGTFFGTVTTLLIPQGSAAPSMLLVVVVKAPLLRTGPSATRWSRPTWPAARTARGGPPSSVVAGREGRVGAPAGPPAWRFVRPTWQRRAGGRCAGGWLAVGGSNSAWAQSPPALRRRRGRSLPPATTTVVGARRAAGGLVVVQPDAGLGLVIPPGPVGWAGLP